MLALEVRQRPLTSTDRHMPLRANHSHTLTHTYTNTIFECHPVQNSQVAVFLTLSRGQSPPCMSLTHAYSRTHIFTICAGYGVLYQGRTRISGVYCEHLWVCCVLHLCVCCVLLCVREKDRQADITRETERDAFCGVHTREGLHEGQGRTLTRTRGKIATQ